MKIVEGAVVAAPSVGPAIIIFAGYTVPVFPLGLSVLGLLLARAIAPPPLRYLSRLQHWALTALLILIDGLIVIGSFSRPLGPGSATILGIGLGFSGLLAIEFFADRGLAAMRAFMGDKGNKQ